MPMPFPNQGECLKSAGPEPYSGRTAARPAGGNPAEQRFLCRQARRGRSPGHRQAAVHYQGRTACRPADPPALRHQLDLSARSLLPAASDFRHRGAAAPLAGHGGKLALDARLLGDDVSDRRRAAGRPAVLPVLVRAVPRLLDGVRGGRAARLPVPAGRRHEQRRPVAVPARQRGNRRSRARRPTPRTWRKPRPPRGSTWRPPPFAC